MPLTEYRKKRDFRRTPEPKGSGKSAGSGRRFVIQKHAASRLHYDFRLEFDGVLKSWAVPKGPSLDPSVKSLAVQVEDHPLDYADFEGVIPEGEYGGGTVMVWDQGTWQPQGKAGQDLKEGRLTFRLQGKKLSGQWSLIRMGGKAGEDGKNWLLIKKKDQAARPAKKYNVLTKEPHSALSDRDMETIAEDADHVWSSGGANLKKRGRSTRAKTAGKKRRAKASRSKSSGDANGRLNPKSVPNSRRRKMPAAVKPQLATLVEAAPDGDQWLHEIKFDGYRIVAILKDGKARLTTRRGNDWTDRFQRIAEELESLASTGSIKRVIFDGEVVALDPDGKTSFQRLQNFLKRSKTDEILYYAFDLLYLDEFDLAQAPLIERKALLGKLILNTYPENDGVVRYSDHIQGHGDDVLRRVCKGRLEGVVSKLANATYQAGRSRQWLKSKCLARQEFVIGGYTKPSGARTGFGALLLGYYRKSQLIYCGRVGTGFTNDSLKRLAAELKRHKRESPPFENPPTGSERRGVTWVQPTLVCEVEFTEWTDDGRLRHPAFQGLREDKRPKEVVREEAASDANGHTQKADGAVSTKRKTMRSAARKVNAVKSTDPVQVAGVRLTHPDRVLYPQQELTKRDLADFYESIGDWILPHIVERPLTLVRCPQGSGGDCFYQKHLTESMPDALCGVWVKEKGARSQYVVVEDLPGLVSLVQMGVLEIHPWPARTDDLEHPDRLVFDLDPGEGTSWKEVIEAAREVRDRLEERRLTSFVRTSGGKGLHVVAPLVRRQSWQRLKEFAKSIAVEMAADAPDKYTPTMAKAKRRGKIFVDYLRNQEGATAVASYSTRARAGAPVATPLRWEELTAKLAPDKYTVKNLPSRLSLLKSDPWEEFFSLRQSIRDD
jgi:bifunctional non-homologous end joining protein LigD